MLKCGMMVHTSVYGVVMHMHIPCSGNLSRVKTSANC